MVIRVHETDSNLPCDDDNTQIYGNGFRNSVDEILASKIS